jgi:hypothetical protein
MCKLRTKKYYNIWSRREFGENIHPELKTFSVVVSSEMTPGFEDSKNNFLKFLIDPKGSDSTIDSYLGMAYLVI